MKARGGSLATLWGLCEARAHFRHSGLPKMKGLASGRQRNRACMCAPVASDERCDFGRAQVVSIASDGWRDGMGANRDCWRDRHVGAHEVSHQNGDVFDRGHSPLWGRSATNLMVPPHSGQGGGSTPVWLSGPGEAGCCFACAVGSTWIVRSERQRASLSVRWPLARNPKCRMRWKPSGKAWSRKRRMNSSGFRLMVFTTPSSR
jgi:hypothetical protein